MDKEINDAQNLETSENTPPTYNKRSENISMEEPTRKDVIMMLGRIQGSIDELRSDTNERMDNLGARVGNLETKMGKMQTDVSNLKGRAVCDATRSSAKTIAERTVNAKFVRILDRSKIHSMADKVKNKGKLSGISDASLQSFRGADTVIEVMLEGCLHYIAVESSYVGDSNDARRAARNAEYITRFTGTKATPVVACVTCNYDKTEYGVEPYHITDRSLAPE